MVERIYLVVTGAGTARLAPQLLRELAVLGPPVLAVPTANADAVVSRADLYRALADLGGGHGVVDSYFDAKLGMPAAPGLVVVAPCSFNSLNRLAQGIADSLALSIAADAIGADWGCIVAPSMNYGLWKHPRTAISLETLRDWGVRIVDTAGPDGVPRLTAVEPVVAAVRKQLGEVSG